MYCPECGQLRPEVENESEGVTIVEAPEVTANEVRIAEINAAKEIKLAQIAAGTFKDEVLMEAAVSEAHAQGEADGLREAITPPDEPEPVVIPVPDPEPEPESIDEPEPAPERHEPKKIGLGKW